MTSSSYLKIRRGGREKRDRERERVMDVLSVFANVINNVSERKGEFLKFTKYS